MLLQQLPPYFKARRDALRKAYPNAIFLLPSNDEVLRNPDVHYAFRQESSFFYLTGFEEPESFLLLTPQKMVLFVQRRDAEKEMWEGERYGTEGAKRVFGADEAYESGEFEKKLPELLSEAGGAQIQQIYYRVGMRESMDRRVLGAMEQFRRSLGRVGKSLPSLTDPNEVIGEMRLFKSPDEVAQMRKACKASAFAHKEAMSATKPGMNEFEIEALVDYQCRKQGLQRMGYGSIVAGGKNAACLHYRFNNEELRDNELLLIDAGGEYNYYTADITRTFPIGRKFTKAQATIYDLVLKSQKECIAMAKPGATLAGIHRRATEVLTEGLLTLGLLKGNRDEIIKNNVQKRFYPHGTGHWLGMDVHDVGLYTQKGEPRKLEPGMVFTIEPGLYFQPGDLEAPAEYRNIGIRIEDDILVTPTGCEVMTADAPKEREEIEALKAH
jgi:Xaa-Pro aminopeptidase